MSEQKSIRGAFGFLYILIAIVAVGGLFSLDQEASSRPTPGPKKRPARLNPALAPITILHGAVLVDSIRGRLPQTALAISKGRIIALLRDSELETWRVAGNRFVDLGGATVVPGLVDAHAHIAGLGAQSELLQLGDAEDIFDLCARVESHLVTFKGAWLLGRGWDQSKWTGPRRTLPSSPRMLDQVTRELPSFLVRVDGHAAWANSAALARAGIVASTPDPKGGKILRDSQGQATGVLLDTAMSLVSRHIPTKDAAAAKRHMLQGLNAAAKAGLTTVHDAGMGRGELAALLQLAAEAPLPIRVYVMLGTGDAAFLDQQLALGPRVGLHGDRVTIRAVKLFQDGAMGSRGAALLQPYSDAKDSRGLLVTAPAELEARAKKAAAAGFQLCTHAIGDRANRLVIDLYQRLLSAGIRAARPRLEHAQVLSPEDLPRLAKLGIIASMQPTHATSDMRWAEARLGSARLFGAYAWQRLRQSGAVLAFGSDAPVEPIDPLQGLYAAVTRQSKAGEPTGGWLPEQRLSGLQALAAFTRGAAVASFEEQERGRIAPGQLADLTVLSGDPVALAARQPQGILGLRVAATYIRGELVKPLAE